MTAVYSQFLKLKSYCEREGFKGWDPYDGLNSKVFQALPFFKKSAFCRLVEIQGFKRCPFNLRKLFGVPKGYNAKGIGLFLQGYCNLYHCVEKEVSLEEQLGSKETLLTRINQLSQLLLSLQSKGYSGACWGYNFDWQSKAFFLPKYTPTVVATSFVVEALLSAYEITKNKEYLDVAKSSACFILKDLNRIQKERGFMFSYSPLDSRAVYNATLLGTKTLALLYKYTDDEDYKNMARMSALAVCDVQNPDGSFPHSDQVGNTWRDNFHTGFKLESLAYYQKYCKDDSFQSNINRGYLYWKNHFFNFETGLAKYYDETKQIDLIDLHCAAQAMATLYKTDNFINEMELATKVVSWPIENMQDKHQGYFYFQKNGNKIIKIPYMRWPNGWMFYGMSYYFLSLSEHDYKIS